METLQENRIEQLKPRQDAIARMIALGATDKEISESLSVSPYTVRAEINAIHKILHTKNRAHIAYFVGIHQGRQSLVGNNELFLDDASES